MSRLYPSIQSFFKREVPPSNINTRSPDRNPAISKVPGDGFTSSEIQAATDPLRREFDPEEDYEECDIGCLIPGPMRVKIDGRIVAFNAHHGKSKSQSAARGWHHLIVKDDTGAICVTLYFVSTPYPLHLGLLVTIYTPFISSTKKDERFTVPNASLNTSIFPGRDPAVHLVLHPTSDAGVLCRIPLGISQCTSTPPSGQGSQNDSGWFGRRNAEPLQGLITLKNYLAGGHEIVDVKILVCIKSIGAKRTIANKQGGASELQEVAIFDETAETVLTLWNEQLSSPKLWKPSETILLISSPGHKVSAWGKTSLGLTWQTIVEIEPEFTDAEWLKKFSQSLIRKESACQMFPEDVWDLREALRGTETALLTIREFDESIRQNPEQIFTAYLSLLMLEVNIMLMRSRNMLLCGQCCGVPIYSNSTPYACKNCAKSIELQLNPTIIGTLLDESGCIGAGKLLWSASAWEELFGRSVLQFISLESREMRLLEQRISGMRITLFVGWKEEVGRLAVLAVRS